MAQHIAHNAGGAAGDGEAAPPRAAGGPASTLAVGMEVVDAAGVSLGRVKAIRGHDFLLARTLQRDVYVPLEYVGGVSRGRVGLTLGTADVSVLNLETPPLL